MTILDDALSTIPGYTRAAAAAANAHRYRPGRSSATRVKDSESAATAAVRSDILRTIGDQMAAGEEIPEDIAQRLLDAEMADALARRRADMIALASRDLKNDAEAIAQEGVDDALAYLNARLDETIQKVREHADRLDGIEDATSAILDSPQSAAEWASVVRLTADYDEIRAAQSHLVHLIDDTTDHNAILWFNTCGLYRDAIEVSPFFQDRRLRFAAQVGSGHSQPGGAYVPPTAEAQQFAEWLRKLPPRVGTTADQETLSDSHRWWDSEDRGVELIRIAKGSQPWVPDTSRITNAFAAAIGATRDGAGAADEARRYSQITGWSEMTLPTTGPYKDSRPSASTIAKEKKHQEKLLEAASQADARREQQERADARERARYE